MLFDIERMSVNLFHTAKVGVFLHACKFFSDFLIEIWRQGRECATSREMSSFLCRFELDFLSRI